MITFKNIDQNLYDPEGLKTDFRKTAKGKSGKELVRKVKRNPEKYEKGKLITFDGDVEADCGVCIFHAGTKLGTPDSSEFVTSGGRVLGITAVRDTLEEAVRAAYAAAERVHFDGKYSRSDIGLSALRESRLKNG